jgi:hypothetical protein
VSPYLLAAYAVFWALPLALVLSMWARQRRLERQIGILESEEPRHQRNDQTVAAGGTRRD